MNTIQWLNESLEKKYRLTEAKEDKEKFVRFAGKELADEFDKLRADQRISGEESGYYYWMNKPLSDLENFVKSKMSSQTGGETRRQNKAGADLMYDGEGWKIYKINTYDAAKYYGENTTWCISGRYKGRENEGQKWFNSYKHDGVQDYYFLIPANDPMGKWCYLYFGDKIHDKDTAVFWDAEDNGYLEAAEINKVMGVIPQEVLLQLPGIKKYLPSEQSDLLAQEIEANDGTYVYDPEQDEKALHWAFIKTPVRKVIVSANTSVNDAALCGRPFKELIFEDGTQPVHIGGAAFQGCGELTSIKLPSNLDQIDDYAFSWCSSLTQLSLPEGLTWIWDDSFLWCKNLESLVIPNTVAIIGSEAFRNCKKLSSVSFEQPCKLSVLERKVFSGCEALTEFVVPDSVEDIEPYAFADCDSLTDVWIPAATQSIGYGAFSNCSKITLHIKGEHRPQMFRITPGVSGSNIIDWVDAGIQESWNEVLKY